MDRQCKPVGSGVMPTAAAMAVAACALHCSGGPAADEDAARARQLAAVIEKLAPLHRKLGKPQPGDWLAGPGANETGQTFQQYIQSSPVRPIGDRRVIYIQPLGDFTTTQRRIIDLTADFMGRYFGLPVTTQKDLPLSVIPQRARRVHPTWGDRQILTTYVLNDLLAPRLPRDAAACIALTTSDLWPGEGWNFVFGQASLRQRVGVWSIYRNGDPAEGPDAFRLCLLRTIKTATHETGHMFSMQHCIAYECNMCGSNSRQEADRRPLALCPECLAKLCWSGRTDVLPRYVKLLDFARRHGLAAEAAVYEKSIRALGGAVPPAEGTSAPASRP